MFCVGCCGHEATDARETDGETMEPPAACEHRPTSGPWGASAAPWDGAEQPVSPLFGVTISTSPPVHDAGLSSLVGAGPLSGDLLGEWPVNGAVVINVDPENPRVAWLQDAASAVSVSVGTDLRPPPSPGAVVTFVATRLRNDSGDVQVATLRDWTSADVTVAVPVVDAQSRDLSAGDVGRNVRVYGAPVPLMSCEDGVAMSVRACTLVRHGDIDTAVLETGAVLESTSSCYDIIAPVVHHVDGEEDFYAMNLVSRSWMRVYVEP